MSNQHHRRLHGRQGPAEAWTDFQKDFKDVANKINPFEQNTTPKLELRAPAPGTVSEVRVSEGAKVEANAVLVVLE